MKIRITKSDEKQERHPSMVILLPEVCTFKFVSSPMTRTATQFAEQLGQLHRLEVEDAKKRNQAA